MHESLSAIVPEKCQACPLVIKCGEEITVHETFISKIIDNALDPRIDRVTEHLTSVVSLQMPEGIIKEVQPEELAKAIRQKSSEQIDKIEDKINERKAQMAKAALSCFGPVTATTEHNRRSFEITICNSGSKPVTAIEPAIVKSHKI